RLHWQPSSMATPKLENYLRTYRKRSGLTQREVAFLVGCRNGAQVSRYEKRRRLPPLRTALACEAAFGVPVSELFAGLREAAGQAAGERLLALKSKLETRQAQGREARLAGANAVRIPLATKIAALLEDFQPAVVVAKEPPTRKKVNRARTRKVLELVRHKASLRGIRTRVFKRRVARNPFGAEERLTKYKIATALADRFAEPRPVLP